MIHPRLEGKTADETKKGRQYSDLLICFASFKLDYPTL
jgi:hypothetical protein